MMQKRLIVGLGNPGRAYEGTRHNIGQRIVRTFADAKGVSLKETASVKGELGQGVFEETKVYFLQPLTYMNCSGEAVRLCLDYFEISPDEMMVVADDIALPFGKLRMRPQGSSGGHNGLKNIEIHVKTQEYPRLRIGVGDREHGELADYVLGRFGTDEMAKLPEIIEKAVKALELWTIQGLNAAMQSVNQEGENNG
jgi:PTH1 family peptidyl-tRNA hydrolase